MSSTFMGAPELNAQRHPPSGSRLPDREREAESERGGGRERKRNRESEIRGAPESLRYCVPIARPCGTNHTSVRVLPTTEQGIGP